MEFRRGKRIAPQPERDSSPTAQNDHTLPVGTQFIGYIGPSGRISAGISLSISITPDAIWYDVPMGGKGAAPTERGKQEI